MSAIADFRILTTDKLEALKESAEIKTKKRFFRKVEIDNYWNFLDQNATKLKEFEWSGYVFGNLLIYLQENRGIDLLTSEFESTASWISEKRKASVMMFTMNHKKAYFDKLKLENFKEAELIEFNKEFSEDDNPELALAEMDGIKAIQNALSALQNENEVVLLTVG